MRSSSSPILNTGGYKVAILATSRKRYKIQTSCTVQSADSIKTLIGLIGKHTHPLYNILFDMVGSKDKVTQKRALKGETVDDRARITSADEE